MKNTHEQAEIEYDRIRAALNAAISDRKQRDFLPVRQGTGLSTEWLRAFSIGKIGDAGFKRLYVLAAWLKEHGYMDASSPVARVQPISSDMRSGYEREVRV